MARKVDELKRLSAVCEENQFDNLILGEITDVLNEKEIIVQPLGREEILVDVNETEIFDTAGEKLSSITLEDPAVFLVTINFRDNKIFLLEREIFTEPEKNVTFNLDNCHYFHLEEPEIEPEPIFLSENSNVVPVDVDDDEGEDSSEAEPEAEPEAEATADHEEIISALIDRIDKLEVALQDREAEFIRETEKYMKEKAKFNVAMKEKEKKINLLAENLKNKETLIVELSAVLWQND